MELRGLFLAICLCFASTNASAQSANRIVNDLKTGGKGVVYGCLAEDEAFEGVR